ncbi:MAG: hypothetical protein DMG40_17150 [Acidobacteria bacterium]|nr:MAG: hypothetical protein DMG40_17150 [Acidobacteriota bacterium]
MIQSKWKTSRAVSRNGNARALGVAGVEPDQFDHQIKFIGNVDFTRHAIGLARHEGAALLESCSR